MKASPGAGSGESGAEIPPLSGWSGIQHHLSQHDFVMVKDHADDIDTLLVFVSGMLNRCLASVSTQPGYYRLVYFQQC